MWKKKDSAENASESKNWYKDKYQYVLVQRNVLAVATLVALVLAMFAVFAVMMLTPHKSVEPFVIQIDEKSGIVETVEPETKREILANEAVDNYFVVKYVTSRETYDRSDLRERYNVVRLMSAPTVFKEFLQGASASNPQSPAALLQDFGARDVKIKSVTYLDDKDNDEKTFSRVAQVRVLLTDRTNKDPVANTYHKIATISFEFADLELNREDRFINPLGFRVISYRIDEDALP